MAIVKENGYGLGLVEYVKFLSENGISFFAVEKIEEAINLRESGIKEEILILEQYAIKENIETLVNNNIIITLGSKEDIQIADKIGQERKKKVKAYLEIDTGIGLHGFAYDKRDEMIESLKNMTNIKIEGTFSRFVDSSQNDKFTKIQFQRFIDVIEVLKMNKIETGLLNICDQTAFFRFSNMNLNIVRIDEAFLGRTTTVSPILLRKVLTLETKISEIRKIQKGFYIGKSKLKKDIRIAIIPYSSSNLPKQKYILINKSKCRILGKVENNMICDIEKNDIKVGEKVLLPIDFNCIDKDIRREYR